MYQINALRIPPDTLRIVSESLRDRNEVVLADKRQLLHLLQLQLVQPLKASQKRPALKLRSPMYWLALTRYS
jgi:hypothetical protein